MQDKVWERLLAMCTTDEEYNDILGHMLLDMAQKDQISMTWDDKQEDIVYFMTDEQKEKSLKAE